MPSSGSTAWTRSTVSWSDLVFFSTVIYFCIPTMDIVIDCKSEIPEVFFWQPQSFLGMWKHNSNLCLCLHVAIFSLCLCVFCVIICIFPVCLCV
ncbi:unnamed protein product [Nyctereutes procyonoides]|uniref:(raccoon dog) hypothetical protein n=1 Tax=Nyctereutes procyonoides TaxID=34880 RepID=A0A811Y4W0_NYCPR|nr:unnamed protein product [Nyctereutes procyonoides]